MSLRQMWDSCPYNGKFYEWPFGKLARCLIACLIDFVILSVV